MRAGIDISKLHSLSKLRGIGFYTDNLISSLKKYTDIEVKVIEEGGNYEGVDLIHYPFFDLFRSTLPFAKNLPTVVTVHDVIPLVFPEHYPPGIKGRLHLLRQRFSLNNVKVIITDSESSKKDIVKHLGIKPEKIHVVYLAQADHFRIIKEKEVLTKLVEKYKLPEKFFIYTGSVNWNKNLINVAKGCVDAGVDLVLTGKGFEMRENMDHKELKSFKEFLTTYSDNPRIHILGYVEDEDLVGLMNLAQAVLLISFYEGFGLTILEGQACGAPVITSNVSSMPEVGGKGAFYVDPSRPADIAKAVIRTMEDDRLRERLIERGFENLKRFSWRKAAQETATVYEEVFRKP